MNSTAKSSRRIVVGFGDSITEGAGATSYPNSWLGVVDGLLRIFLRELCQVHNAGVGDNTISPRTTNYALASKPSALERVDEIVALQPDLVFVCFGLNDMRFGTPVEIFAEDLRKVVDHLRAKLPTAQLILTNVFHMTGWKRYEPRDRGSPELAAAYNAAIARIAAALKLPLADVTTAMGACDALICPDGVHCNDLGHRLIGHCVFAVLATQTDYLRRQ